MRQHRHRKERADFKFRLDKTTLNQDDLKRQVRRQMRTAQKSTRSKDTTQSLYTCVFDDCAYRMHADENAAINIVRKWTRDKGIH